MIRFIALLLFASGLIVSTVGCGGATENKVIQPTTTQTEEELAAIDEEREANMDTESLRE